MIKRKHIMKDFEKEDNFLSEKPKHMILDDFEASDNFVSGKVKHKTEFEEDDNFRSIYNGS